jgi:hypothetical protein
MSATLHKRGDFAHFVAGEGGLSPTETGSWKLLQALKTILESAETFSPSTLEKAEARIKHFEVIARMAIEEAENKNDTFCGTQGE